MNKFPILAVIFLVAVGCQSDPEWAPIPGEPRAFVTTLGTDTVTVEVFVKAGNVIEGTLVERTPLTYVIEYRAELNDDGHIVSLVANRESPASNPDGMKPNGFSINIEDTLATIVRKGGRNPGENTVAVEPGVIPTLSRASAAMFVFEQIAAQMGDDSAGVMLLTASGSAPRKNRSRRISADSISMDFFGSPRVGWSDDQGQVLGTSGAATTMKSEVRRVEPFLVGPYADRWATMDAAGTGIGTPSPGATAEASFVGSDFEVRYSQPAKRGRDIWGGLVPNGSVWRTGANAATHFSTSADISIGDNDLDAGTYTLWSVWEDENYTLIVNEETNQWGTSYDSSRDLFSTPMQASEVEESVERFTISFEESDAAAWLVFEWDTMRYTVEIASR